MALVELVGTIAGVFVAVIGYYISKINPFQYASVIGNIEDNPTEFNFKFDGIFELKLKSRNAALAVQLGFVAVLFAVAFVIVTVGLRNLGFSF